MPDLFNVPKPGAALLNRAVPCLLSDFHLLIFNDKGKLTQFVTTSTCPASTCLKDSRVLVLSRAEKQQRITPSATGSAASCTVNMENQCLKIRLMDVFCTCCHYTRTFDSFCLHYVHNWV